MEKNGTSKSKGLKFVQNFVVSKAQTLIDILGLLFKNK